MRVRHAAPQRIPRANGVVPDPTSEGSTTEFCDRKIVAVAISAKRPSEMIAVATSAATTVEKLKMQARAACLCGTIRRNIQNHSTKDPPTQNAENAFIRIRWSG